MIKVYSICLVLGIVGLLVVILGGAFAENLGRADRDPSRRLGGMGRSVIGALIGFGMAGLSAEFSTLDATWQLSLVIAAVGASAGAVWARYAARTGSNSDAGPV